MSNTRLQLRRKIKQADHLLGLVMEYLKEVGLVYSKDHSDIADQFALLYGAIEEVRKALDKLYEEM